MQLLGRRARRRAQHVPEAVPQPVVDEQRLGCVAAGGERLHQQAVPALAVGSAGDQAPGCAFCRVELAATDLDARPAHELERPNQDLLEPPALLVDPGRVLAGEEGARRNVLSHAARSPGAGKVALRNGALGAVQTLGGRFGVDPGAVGEREPHLAAPVERNRGAQLREQRAEAVGRAGLGPECVRELVAGHRPVPVDRQEREREPALSTGELALDAVPVDPCDEPAAELDPRLSQGFAKVTATAPGNNPGMAKLLINLTHGPEAPTRAALGFLVASAAAEAGHDVSLFLAGDSVQLLREPVLDSLVGLGTGSLRAHYDTIVERGGTFYVSGMSSKARGFEPNGQAEAALPARLVELVLEADRVLTY